MRFLRWRVRLLAGVGSSTLWELFYHHRSKRYAHTGATLREDWFLHRCDHSASHRLENSVLCNFRNVCRVHSWKTNEILHIDEAPDPMNTLGNKMGSGPVRLDDTRTSWTTPRHELTGQCSIPAHRVVDTDVGLIPRHDVRKPLFGYCQQKGVTKIEFVNCTTFGEFIYKEVRMRKTLTDKL